MKAIEIYVRGSNRSCLLRIEQTLIDEAHCTEKGDHLPRTWCFEVNKVSCCYWLKRKYINNSFSCPWIESKAFWALFKLRRILCNIPTIERSLTSFEIIYHRSLRLIHVFFGYLFRWTIGMVLLIHLFWHYFCYWRHILSRGKFDICNVVTISRTKTMA